MMSAKTPSTSARPSATALIAARRPRGEAVSSPVSRNVGQCGRHNPQATQASSSSPGGSVSGYPTHQRRPGSRPGFEIPTGSNAALTLRCRDRDAGGVPQGSGPVVPGGR